MGELKIPIIIGDKVNSSSDYQDAIPVNLIAVTRQVKGAEGYLYSHDGLSQYTYGQGIDRGAIYNERMGKSFRVSGKKLLEITATGSTVIGDIPGSDLVTLIYSFNSLEIIAEGAVFRYNGSSLSQVTDPDLGYPISGTWIDGYYFYTDGEYIYHTDISEETSIDPLKFATSEISPDPTKAVGRTQDDLVIVFNRYTTEYFINAGSPQFAFTRLNQKAVSSGIVSTQGWCEMDGSIFMLGGRKGEGVSVHIIGAGQTKSVSTRNVDQIIGKYTELELFKAKLECRLINQDKLLYVHLPSDTLVFNKTIAEKFGVESAWTELRTDDNGWRAINGIYDPNLNKWFYGDKIDSRIGYLNELTAGHYGQPVHSVFYTPLIPLESASVDELEINTISGYGSSDVNLFISTTRDGSYHSLEWSKESSVVQQYDYRYIVRRLGYVRRFIGFKFRSYHTDKINFSGLEIKYG